MVAIRVSTPLPVVVAIPAGFGCVFVPVTFTDLPLASVIISPFLTATALSCFATLFLISLSKAFDAAPVTVICLPPPRDNLPVTNLSPDKTPIFCVVLNLPFSTSGLWNAIIFPFASSFTGSLIFGSTALTFSKAPITDWLVLPDLTFAIISEIDLVPFITIFDLPTGLLDAGLRSTLAALETRGFLLFASPPIIPVFSLPILE